jgi:Xaa-Pro aminopeptidase
MYPHQAERLTQTLDRAGLDALVATAPENVAYVTGFRSVTEAVFHTQQLAVFARGGTALVTPAIDPPSIVADGADANHVVCFGGFLAQFAEPASAEVRRVREILAARAASPADALARALDALGVTGGAVGVDETRLTPDGWKRITDRLGDLRVVNGAGLFLEARRVKAPWEIECLDRALRICEEALNEVIQMLKPGVTEREALRVWEAEVIKREAAPLPAVIATGSRAAIPAPWPTERALRPGDLVRFDVGCVYRGYCGTVARVAVMGEPGSRETAAFDAVQAGLEAAVRAVKPGVAAGRVHAAAVEAVRAGGLERYERIHVGHAIGLEPYERPKLSAGNETALEVGEVFRVEIPYFEIGALGLNVKDTVLVTTGGTRLMNRSHHGLVVLD